MSEREKTRESKYSGEERRRPQMNGEAREAWAGPEGEERRAEFRDAYEKYKILHHYHTSKPGGEKDKEEKKKEPREHRKKSFWSTPL